MQRKKTQQKMGRGRKPKERKGYFYEKEEEAVVKYNSSQNETERNAIFNTVLLPALTKMIESIIRRYKLYIPDEEFKQTFDDTISYLLTKISNFKPVMKVYEEIDKPLSGAVNVDFYDFAYKSLDERLEFPDIIMVDAGSSHIEEGGPAYHDELTNPMAGTGVHYYKKVEKHFKAYSYCGTVCKNYLIFKIQQFAKEQQRNTSYDTVADSFENDERYSDEPDNSYETAEKLLKKIAAQIKTMVDDPELNSLSANEVKVGNALYELFTNWEEILDDGHGGSNKLQKSNVLYFLRETTNMTTKEVRDNMKPYKSVYQFLKKTMLD